MLVRPRPSVSPSVSHHFFSKTGHEIILIFCMKLDIDNRKKLTEPFFGQKFWIIQKLQICAKKWGFWHFAENLTMEWALLIAEIDKTKCLLSSCENRMSGKNLVLEIYFSPWTWVLGIGWSAGMHSCSYLTTDWRYDHETFRKYSGHCFDVIHSNAEVF